MTEDGSKKSDITNKTIDVTNSSANTDSAGDGPKSRKEYSIEILRLIHNAQKQHGLRHGDYQRYRGTYLFILVVLPAIHNMF